MASSDIACVLARRCEQIDRVKFFAVYTYAPTLTHMHIFSQSASHAQMRRQNRDMAVVSIIICNILAMCSPHSSSSHDHN